MRRNLLLIEGAKDLKGDIVEPSWHAPVDLNKVKKVADWLRQQAKEFELADELESLAQEINGLGGYETVLKRNFETLLRLMPKVEGNCEA